MLSDEDIAVLLYALSVTKDNLQASIADADQSSDDRAIWASYVSEIESLTSKLNALEANSE